MADTAASGFSGIGVWTAMASGDLFPFIDVSGTGAAKNSVATLTELVAQLKLNTIAGTGANTFTALQTITQASANAGVIASTGYSLTGSNATNMIDLAGTWNTTGAPTAIKLNITNTASDGASLLMDLRVGGTSQFKVLPSGEAIARHGISAGQGTFIDYYAAASILMTSDSAIITMGISNDIYLSRAATNTLELGSEQTDGTYMRINGDKLVGSKYISLGHDATNGVISVAGGGVLSITTGLSFLDLNIVLGTTTGTKIGTATTQKLAFWNATPVVQQAAISDVSSNTYTGADTVSLANLDAQFGNIETAINTIIARLETIGLIAA